MVLPRTLLVCLLVLFPLLAAAAGEERPISGERVGSASPATARRTVGASDGTKALIAWGSVYRGGQAALVDASGRMLHGSAVGLPMSTPDLVFRHEGVWYVVGNNGWVRVNDEGELLDPARHQLQPLASSTELAVWTGSSLFVANPVWDGPVHVHVYDARLQYVKSIRIERGLSSGGIALASDGETVLLVYGDSSVGRTAPRPLLGALFNVHGDLLLQKGVISEPTAAPAIGTRGYGAGYDLVTMADGAQATFSWSHVSHELRRRHLSVFGSRGTLHGASSTLSWDGAAFTFLYRPAILPILGVRLTPDRPNEEGIVVDALTSGDVPRTHFSSIAIGDRTLVTYQKAKLPSTSEVSYLHARAGRDFDALVSAEDVRIDLGIFDQVTPAAASSATQSLVAWRERLEPADRLVLMAARVAANGNVLDPQSLLLGGGTCADSWPSVGSNGRDFLVAWFGNSGVMASRVMADGTVAQAVRLKLQLTPCISGRPFVVSNGADYLVVWRNPGVRGDVFGVRVRADGVLLDEDPQRLGVANAPIYGASSGTDYLLAFDRTIVRIAADNGKVTTLQTGAEDPLSGVSSVWWNGTSYSVLRWASKYPRYDYTVTSVTASRVGAISAATPQPAFVTDEGRLWGQPAGWACTSRGCWAPYGMFDRGRHVLRELRFEEGVPGPSVRIGGGAPVGGTYLQYGDFGSMPLVPLQVTGGRAFVVYVRRDLQRPNAGGSRLFINPLEENARMRAARP